MTKTPFIAADKLEQITAEFPTPFHLYDEKGIRETARAVNAAFSWNPGFKEFFAVKATPNPVILKILKEEGCGVDCATDTELVMSNAVSRGSDQRQTRRLLGCEFGTQPALEERAPADLHANRQGYR